MKKSQITKLKNKLKTLLIIVLGAFVVIPFILMIFNRSPNTYEGLDIGVTNPTHSFEFRNNTTMDNVNDSMDDSISLTPMAGATSDANGMNLDGTGQYVEIPSFTLGGGDMTFETYVKYNDTTSYAPVFSFGSATSNVISIQRYDDEATIIFGFNNASGNIETSNSDVALTTNWQHIVGTISSTNGVKLYSDGVPTTMLTSTEVPESVSRTSQFIGKSFDGSKFLNGIVAYLRIWDGTALESSDITTLFDNKDTLNLFETVSGESTTGVSGEDTTGPSGEDTTGPSGESCEESIRCVANNGTKEGEPLCCGQSGVVNDIAYNCPVDLPYCVGYTCGGEWGKCVADDPASSSTSSSSSSTSS
jgi:hypothetical protein